MFFFLGWLFFSLLVGALGSSRHIGFGLAFLLSMLLSPLIGFIVAMAMGPKNPPVKCSHCGWSGFEKEVEAGFCPACGKNKDGLTRSDYQARAEGVTLSSSR